MSLDAGAPAPPEDRPLGHARLAWAVPPVAGPAHAEAAVPGGSGGQAGGVQDVAGARLATAMRHNAAARVELAAAISRAEGPDPRALAGAPSRAELALAKVAAAVEAGRVFVISEKWFGQHDAAWGAEARAALLRRGWVERGSPDEEEEIRHRNGSRCCISGMHGVPRPAAVTAQGWAGVCEALVGPGMAAGDAGGQGLAAAVRAVLARAKPNVIFAQAKRFIDWGSATSDQRLSRSVLCQLSPGAIVHSCCVGQYV